MKHYDVMATIGSATTQGNQRSAKNGGKVHELKCYPRPFRATLAGDKRFEFRRDDRPGGFWTGDSLKLKEWSPVLGLNGRYTGRWLTARVTHIERGLAWGIPSGFCVMSVELESHPFVSRTS